MTMRRAVAMIVSIVFAVLVAADGVHCPEGCTNDARPAAASPHSATDGACALCVGGLRVAVTPLLDCCFVRLQAIVMADPSSTDDVPVNPPDHPPRP
jgi:hypothetical protein